VDRIEQVIVDLKDSLEREIGNVGQTMREGFTQVTNRFDDQGARLERHVGLWQTGARWSARMDAWAEKVDASLESQGPRNRRVARAPCPPGTQIGLTYLALPPI
jgi:hypothetical protein